jgi:hypothetical protein
MYSKWIVKDWRNIVIKNAIKQNEYIIIFFKIIIEMFKSYRNIKLCTQIVTLRFCKIVIKNAIKQNEYIIKLF